MSLRCVYSNGGSNADGKHIGVSGEILISVLGPLSALVRDHCTNHCSNTLSYIYSYIPN